MILDALAYRSNISENNDVISDSFELQKLLQEMPETLFIQNNIDSFLGQRFDYLNNRKQDPFGDELKNDEKLRANQSLYLRNHLRHKLVRIQKEFQFARKFLKNYQSLTPREIEIIKLLAKGLNNPAIAKQLFISRYTVEQHRKHLNYKLKIKSFPHLMNYAYAFDLI